MSGRSRKDNAYKREQEQDNTTDSESEQTCPFQNTMITSVTSLKSLDQLDIINNVTDLIAIVDEKGDRCFLSDSYSDFLGYSRENIIGTSPFDTMHPDDVDRARRVMCQAFTEWRPFKEEVRFRHADGSWIWLEISGKPMYTPSDGPILLTISRDVTQRKMVETQLVETKNRADRLNRAKSEFLSTMSHELRSPLNAILGFSQILQDDVNISRCLSSDGKKYLSYIREAGAHLLEMVNDILDLSKVEAQKLELNRKHFDVAVMLSRSPSTVITLARKKRIRMITDIQPDIGYLNGDEVRIKQVVYNLLSNAIKYTSSGKRIGIKARGTDDEVVITVWDEGRGISSEIQERLFTPFERGTEEQNDSTSGTGLGLLLSKKLVELHRGTLHIQSRVGVGTQVTIRFPGRITHDQYDGIVKIENDAEEGIGREQVGNFPKPGTGNSKKILIVDDNAVSNVLLTTFLQRDGYMVHCVRTGREGVREALSESYDLVLMDIRMPEIDGVSIMKQIRGQIKERKTPIVALTAFAMKGDRERFISEGFDEYISKPVEYREFSNKIKRVISGL